MKKSPSVLLETLIGLLILTACSTINDSAMPVTMTTPPQSAITETSVPPTPASPGNSITWRDLQVTMDRVEITDSFITEFGSQRDPSVGDKFFWVHVQLKNVGQVEVDIPPIEHFSVLYAAAELKPTYGHRKEYTDYSTLESPLFPNLETDGWIRFDIPTAAELMDLRFVFLPESSHVGATFSSPNYPYAEGKATFVWKCVP